MITRVMGKLDELTTTAALLDVGGGLTYEVLVPACDIGKLQRRTGQDVTLHTIHYIEGDPTRGNLTPRLIGFQIETDRDFFHAFTSVKGIGVRKALRALARPIPEIAAAIEAKDTKGLVALPEIGKRMAEQIIAQLHGKVGEYAGGATAAPGGSAEPELSEAAREAVAALVQLGERRADAEALVERVQAVAPDLAEPGEIIQHVYKLRAGGS